MDHYSILDHSSSSPSVLPAMPPAEANRSATASVSAGIAAANARLGQPGQNEPRFPGEDAGRSLAEMAHADLDAALQLLAERAQYITGASGAAIALRRSHHNDMLCHATAGSNAPELGALLSTEHGLSGECVRTRKLLRCDDAAHDPRVNREVCLALGIASVIVMPVNSDEHVLGVFELFSDKPSAFTERDLSALERLAEMVETAVQHSPLPNTDIVPADIQLPADAVPVRLAPPSEPEVEAVAPPAAPRIEAVPHSPAPAMAAPEIPPAQKEVAAPEPPVVKELAKESAKEKEILAAPAPQKTLFWSAAMRAASAPVTKDVETISVPVTLRNLQKCQACGFPVSQGRSFCVECEEKQWRGQRVQPAAEPQKRNMPIAPEAQIAPQIAAAAAASQATVFQSAAIAPAAPAPSAQPIPSPSADLKIYSNAVAPEISQTLTAPSIEPPPAIETVTPPSSDSALLDLSPPAPAAEDAMPFLSATLQSESWFSANKYVLGALLLVAVVIAAIAWLR
jgi:hypothetical protein